MEQRNVFCKMEVNDYSTFMNYYTQIEYSYFKKGCENPKQESKAKCISSLADMISPKRVSLEEYYKLLSQNIAYLYGTSNGEVLGVVIITPNSLRKEIKIQEFYVLKECQGHHVGTLMYYDLLLFLKSQGYSKVKFNLLCSYEGAEEFWKKIGYRISRKEKFTGRVENRYYSKVENISKIH